MFVDMLRGQFADSLSQENYGSRQYIKFWSDV